MKRILFSVCFFALFFSCNSDDDNTSDTSQTEDNFYALTVGNSWVYKNYTIDDMTQELEFSGVVDSISIVGTEEISGEEFYKFKTTTTGNDDDNPNYNYNGDKIDYYRENDGELINQFGDIVYVNNDFNERIIDEQPWGAFFSILQEEPAEVTVEAGTFSCLDMLLYAKTPEGEQLQGLEHYYYAEGIGKISNTVSFAFGGQIVAIIRLDSYNIQ